MMNNKISRIEAELAKTKQKISGLQAHIRELEQQKAELENTDIVGLVRGADMTAQELAALLGERGCGAEAAPSLLEGLARAREITPTGAIVLAVKTWR